MLCVTWVVLSLQVLIKVHACGVNPVETYIRSGTYSRKPVLPYTPGTDVAGVIESVGDSVSAFKVSSIFDGFYLDLVAFFWNLIIALKTFKGTDYTISASWGTPRQKESISYPEALLVHTAGNQ